MADRAFPDQNNNFSLFAVSNADGVTPVSLWADPATHLLQVSGSGSSGGTQYAELATTTPATGTLALGRYQTTLPTLTNGQMNEPMLDSASRLLVNAPTATGSAVPSNAFYIGATDSGTLKGITGIAGASDNTSLGESLSTAAGGMAFNGTGWDKERTATAASNTTGTGLLGVGNLGFDGTNWQSIGAPLQTATTANTAQAMMLTGSGVMSVAFTTSTAQVVANTDAGNYTWVSVHITSQGTSSNVNYQGSNDNSNWVAIPMFTTESSTTRGQSEGRSGIISSGPLSFRYFRLNVTGISGGTTAGTVIFSASPRAPYGTSIFNGNANVQVGSNTATGSALPANAFYMGIGTGAGQLGGMVAISATGDASTGTSVLATSGTLFNGTGWDRMRSGPTTGSVLVSAPTATGSAAPANAFYVGMLGSANLTGLMSTAQAGTGASTGTTLAVGVNSFNGSTMDVNRNNINGVLVAAGTTTTQSATITTYNARSFIAIINITSGTGSVTVSFNGQSTSSYTYTIGSSTALTSGTTAIMIGPGLPATANASFNQPLPRTLGFTATVSGSITFGIDYVLSV